MWKYVFYLIAAVVIIGLIGSGIHLYRVNGKNKKEMAQFNGGPVAVNKKFGNVLVVYYSLSGHTREIAEKIKEKTGGDLYEIITAEEIKPTPLFYMKIKQQIKNKEYPELTGDMPDFSKYDMIFVGSPVWWYTLSTPVSAFLEKVDFQGKKVVPFSTQGSNFGTYFEDFSSQARQANVQTAEAFNNLSDSYDKAVDNKISRWLNRL